MKNNNKFLRNPVVLAFLGSILYWTYLFLTSKMFIYFDAVNYESLGKMIAQQGWIEFFRSGPHREPFYPALIAFSVWLGKLFGISYQSIQTVVQLSILLLTQILALRIMRLLRINNLLCALTVLYLGFSPAIVNSALSLYSEIATYPFILAIVLLLYYSWISFTAKLSRIILLSVATSLLFVIMVLNKAIFELVTPMTLSLFLISVFLTRNKKLIANAIIYSVVFFTVFYSLTNGYKSINRIYNGNYTITDRGWLLYGCTARRMEPLSKERLLTALASVPGEGVCQTLFGEEKCNFWGFGKVDELAYQKAREINKSNMSLEEVQKNVVLLSLQKIRKNPFQYILLTGIDGTRMFFWESTHIGYVVYPEKLTRIFAWKPFKNGIRLGMSVLTIFAIIYQVLLLWRNRKNLLKATGPLLLSYLCLLFIFSFISCYAIFLVLTRYALPIASLYLLIVAYVLQRICFRASNTGKNVNIYYKN